MSKTKSLARIEWLSKLLDSSIPLGNSGYRIGIDPLLGLIPGIGDPLSALLGSYIIIEAARLGASRLTLVKMMANLGFDTLVGAVPLLGDLFDFVFRANQRNILLVKEDRLMARHDPKKRVLSAFLVTLVGTIIFIALIFAVVIFTTFKFLGWLFA